MRVKARADQTQAQLVLHVDLAVPHEIEQRDLPSFFEERDESVW